MVDVSVPLGHDLRQSAFHHVIAVDDRNDRPVGVIGASADVNGDEVAVHDLLAGKLLWKLPYPKQSLVVLHELKAFEAVLSAAFTAYHVTNGERRTASILKLVDKIYVEDALARIDECLDVVGGKLCGHACVGMILRTLDDIPVYGLKRRAHLEEPPKVLARLVPVVGHVGVVSVLVQPNGEVGTLVLVLKRKRVHLDLPPCNEKRTEVALAALGCIVLLLEEVTSTICRALINNKCERLEQHSRADGTHYITRIFVLG